MKIEILTVTLTFICISAHAEFKSGTGLMQDLEADQRGDSTYEVGVATGYVMGVADTVDGIVHCIPATATVKQTKQVVFNYMKNHPESWNKSATQVIVSALRSTWPCPKK